MQRIVYSVLLVFCFSCSVYKIPNPAPKIEFRGVWIATVVNIDWPKNAKDDSEKQKKDFLEILDFYQKLNFNAAIVQIRTAGDAFYETDLAPWSKYLTGKEGEAPKGFNEPLKWMIAETHKRGMEFHAWLNPYRATFNLDTLALSEKHDFYEHPRWMVKYGKKYYYDPGLPEVQKKLTNIISEIVTDYNVDAIHFDDYFYPYKIKYEVFNDSITFKTYGLPNQELADWRRSNVDSLVENIHLAIRKHKPWVQFGISPFGVWKNKNTDPRGSDTKAGQTTYEDLYADPLLWIEKGWIDYLVPQAYWSMEYPPAPHRTVASWWANTVEGTNLYIGNGPYKIKNNPDKAWNRKKEIPKQIAFARNQANITGNVFFSAKSLLGQHENVTKTLKRKFYRFPSQNPNGLAKLNRVLEQPKIEDIQIDGENLKVTLSHTDSIPRFLHFYLYQDPNEKLLIKKSYLSENEHSNTTLIELPKNQFKKNIGVSVIDTFGNESKLQPITQKTD